MKLTKDKAEADNPMDRFSFISILYHYHHIYGRSLLRINHKNQNPHLDHLNDDVDREEEDEDHPAAELKGFTKVRQYVIAMYASPSSDC